MCTSRVCWNVAILVVPSDEESWREAGILRLGVTLALRSVVIMRRHIEGRGSCSIRSEDQKGEVRGLQVFNQL